MNFPSDYRHTKLISIFTNITVILYPSFVLLNETEYFSWHGVYTNGWLSAMFSYFLRLSLLTECMCEVMISFTVMEAIKKAISNTIVILLCNVWRQMWHCFSDEHILIPVKYWIGWLSVTPKTRVTVPKTTWPLQYTNVRRTKP